MFRFSRKMRFLAGTGVTCALLLSAACSEPESNDQEEGALEKKHPFHPFAMMGDPWQVPSWKLRLVLRAWFSWRSSLSRIP